MANIVYRGAAAPTAANTAANKNAALTNDEIDKNFFALNDAAITIGTTSIKPSGSSLTLGGLTSVTTTRLLAGDGTAASPSIAFASDGAVDTGFYWGTDGFTFFTNNGVKTGEIQPGGHLSMVGNVTVGGNLIVNGTTTTVNATTITVDDINIELGSVATPTNDTANGGGITLKGASDKTITWDSSNANWTSNQDWNIATGKVFKINNVSVLNATTLGTNVVNSSLIKLGTGAGFVKSDASGNLTVDASTYSLSSHGHYIGTTAVQSSSADQAVTGILSVTGGTASNFTLKTANVASAATGILYINSGDVTAGNATSGVVSINSGSGFGTAAAGLVTIYSGDGGASSTSGGNVSIQGGGSRAATSTGGNVSVRGGSALSTATTAATGGNVFILGGRTFNASGTKAGGNVYIDGGIDGSTASQYVATAGTVNIGNNASGVGGAGTSAVNIGSTSATTTIAGIIKLPTIGTSGFVKLGAGGQLSQDTSTYLTAEADTLATVTARGASTSTAITLSNGTTNLGHATTNYITTSDNGSIIIKTKNQTTRQAGLLNIQTGNTTAAGSWTGGILIKTGDATGGTDAYAGDITMYPGSSDSAGAVVNITGGDSAGGVISVAGAVTIKGGNVTAISTGGTTSGIAGNLYLYGGDVVSTSSFTKTSGSVYISGGGAGGSGTLNYGSVNIGNTSASSSYGTSVVNIGNSAIATVVNGTVKLPNVGTSGFVKLGAGGQLSADTSTYLTAEADTLATVTARGATTATASTFSGGLSATGGFTSSTDVSVNGMKIGRGTANGDATNTAFGTTALAVVSSIRNAHTAIGYNALAVNVQGDKNTAIGAYALARNTDGGNNVAVGTSALYNNLIGNYNTGMGYQVLYNSTGSANTAFGSTALVSNIAGNYNTAVGQGSLSATNGAAASYNTAIGNIAGNLNSTGANNVFIGADAQAANTGDSNTIVIGKGAVGLGSNTTVIGNSSTTATTIKGTLTVSSSISATNLSGTNTGDETTATIKTKLGITTLSGSNTGDQTIPTTLPHNGTALSATTGTFSGNLSSDGVISAVTSAAAGRGMCIKAPSGDATAAILQFTNNAVSAEWASFSVTNQVVQLNASTGFTCSGNVTAYSDARLKTNITKIDHALDKVEQLNGYTFDRTDVKTARQTGVIAQEVLKVLPEAVLGSEDTTYSVAYGNMMGLMIEAIKELNAKVVDLQNQLANK